MKNSKLVFIIVGIVALFIISFYVYSSIDKDKYVKNDVTIQDQTNTSPAPSDTTVSENTDADSPNETSEPDQNDNVSMPDFTLKNSEGKEISLSDFKGKTVVMNFWASWCGPCKSELPDFLEIEKKYKEKDVVFLMIDVVDGKETSTSGVKYLSDNNLNFENILIDDNAGLFSRFGLSSIPDTFIIDNQGYIKGGQVGAMSKESLESALDKLLN